MWTWTRETRIEKVLKSKMKIPQVGRLLQGGIVILLSVLLLVRIGGLWHNQTPTDEEDMLIKGYRLYQELEFEDAYGSFNVARTIAHIDGDKEKELKALKGMADCTFWTGAVDSCVYRYHQALTLAHELNEPYEEYDIYTKLKQAYMVTVDMEHVMMIGQKIDSLMNATDDKRIRMDMQQKLAMEAIQQQNPKLAESYLLANEQFLDSLSDSERQSAKFTVYGYLRDFYFGQQDYEKARKYSELYIKAGKNGFGTHQMAYMCYDSDAIICAQQKNKKAAFQSLDSMQYGLTLTTGASNTNVMHYHDIKGQVYAIFEEWEKACDEYKKALVAVENTHTKCRPDYFRIENLLGSALMRCQRYDEARNYLADIVRYCKLHYGEKSLAYTDALWTMANLEGYCGKTKAGMQYYIKAVDLCKHLVAEQLRYISIQERNAFWLNFAPKMWAMTAYAMKIGEKQSFFTEKCYDALLFSKAFLLESDRTMAATVQTKCTSEEQRAYYEMLGLQNQLKALMNDYEKNKEHIEKLHERISKQNQQLTPIISKLGYTPFLTLGYQDIKQSLKDDEVLLDFTDYKSDEDVEQFVAFVIKREQEHPKLNKVFTEEKIKLLLAGKPADFLYKEPYASKVIKLIWEPLTKEVKGKKTIYYIPSGILHRIALESLPLSDGSLLGEQYNFVRLSSAREIAKSRKGTQIANYTTATLYGALKYDMDTTYMTHEAMRYKVEPLLAFSRGETVRGDKRFKELPNTKEEIDRIKAILKSRHLKVSAQTGTEGTEESFLAMSGKAPQLLHIATHGFYYNTPDDANEISYLKGYYDAMQLSGLIMAGGNRAWTGKEIPKGVQDGVLTANSIAAMDMRGTDMVVLSACKTGLGVATPEGLFGLQRAFKKAGVQTIIMSLWNVDDEAAKDFMIKFYEELADSQNKWNKRKAFEKAKALVRSKTYIRNGQIYKGDPFFWAGFVMLD